MIENIVELITEEDLQALIDNSVPKGKTIAYKEFLPGSSDPEKKNFWQMFPLLPTPVVAT